MDMGAAATRWLHDAGPLLAGARMTILVSLASIALGFTLGVLINQARKVKVAVVQYAIAAYISFFRGTPLLVQLLMFFYLPSTAGINLPPVLAAILTLSMNTSAFQSEILRAGFESIPKGQIEAARVFGIPGHAILTHIEIPSVVRYTLPGLVSELIDIVKISSLISVISVTEIMRAGQELVSTTYRPLEIYILVGLVYLLLTSGLSLLGRAVEARFARAYR